MKVSFFRRLGSYLLDILIITVISSMLGNVLPNNQKVLKVSNEQMNLLTELSEAINNDDQEKVDKIGEEIDQLSYEFGKVSVYSTLAGVVLYFLYFVVFQKYNNGQTIGKKLLKIEVVDGDGEIASFKQFLIRGIILYPIVFELLDVICVSLFEQSVYLNISSVLSWASVIIFMGCLFTVIFGGRGLHDRICGTSVIMVGSYNADEEEDKVSSWKKTSEQAKKVNEYKSRHTSGKSKKI